MPQVKVKNPKIRVKSKNNRLKRLADSSTRYLKIPVKSIIIVLKCLANSSIRYTIIRDAFYRAESIKSCEDVISGDYPTPWWFVIAKNFLTQLYEAVDISKQTTFIIKQIKSCYIEIDGRKKMISRTNMRKIVDAMIWMHQNEFLSIDISTKKTKIDKALKLIKNAIYKYARKRN